MQTRTSWILLSVIRVLWRQVIKPVSKPSGTIVLLSVLTAATWAQSQPSTLTPSRDSASPGAAVRITVNPALGANQPTGSRLLLRSARGQRGSADIELQIVEWHGDWLRGRIPRDARTDAGAMLLVLLDRRDNIIADSRNRFFRIVEASEASKTDRAAPGKTSTSQTASPDTGLSAFGTQKPGPSPAPDPLPPDRSADKTTRPVPDATPKKVDPRPAPEVPTKQPILTTPGVTATAKSPTVPTTPGGTATAKVSARTMADFVVIADKETEIKRDRAVSFEFTLPAGSKLNERAVLAYMVNPDTGGIVPYLRVFLNGREVNSYDFGSGARRGMWETFDGTGFLRAGVNILEFRAKGLAMKVSDVVLWFHREVQ